jgi:hypothetical protein
MANKVTLCRSVSFPSCGGGSGWSDEELPARHRCISPVFVAPIRRGPRFLSPPCEGGGRGGGPGTISHSAFKAKGGRSWRYQLRGVQSQWVKASWFVNANFARTVPDSSLTTPPGPPFTRGGKCFDHGRFVRNRVPNCSLTSPPAPPLQQGGDVLRSWPVRWRAVLRFCAIAAPSPRRGEGDDFHLPQCSREKPCLSFPSPRRAGEGAATSNKNGRCGPHPSARTTAAFHQFTLASPKKGRGDHAFNCIDN